MQRSPAFSLLELILVTVIIGILVSIGVVRYIYVAEEARAIEAFTVLCQIVAAEQRYYLENDSYTATLTALDIFDTTPTSTNFTFSIPSADASSGYTQAARKSSSRPRVSFGLCLKSNKYTYCIADTCDPGCP